MAAGVSGSGRLRYGGIRDFVLGVRFLDGDGTLVHGGGKVVKNAAGFDLPKMMVGSLGSLGVMVEATLKVFPRAEETATGVVDFTRIDDAVAAMRRVLRGPSEADALDVQEKPHCGRCDSEGRRLIKFTNPNGETHYLCALCVAQEDKREMKFSPLWRRSRRPPRAH